MMGKKDRIIKNTDGSLSVPDFPIIPFIEGDGTGPDIWHATRMVLDAAVQNVYSGQRGIAWMEVYAGEKGQQLNGDWLPDEALDAIKAHVVAIKGPLTTPVGKGIRSINTSESTLFTSIFTLKYS